MRNKAWTNYCSPTLGRMIHRSIDLIATWKRTSRLLSRRSLPALRRATKLHTFHLRLGRNRINKQQQRRINRDFRPLTSSNSISYASPAQQQSRRRHHEHNQCRRLHRPSLALLSCRSKILQSGALSNAHNNTTGTRRTWVAVQLNYPLTAMLMLRTWGLQLHAYLSPRSAGRRIGSSAPDALVDPHGYGHRCTRDDGHGHNLLTPLDERRRRRRQDPLITPATSGTIRRHLQVVMGPHLFLNIII